MTRKQILIVEDETHIAEAIQYNLEKEGFLVSAIAEGNGAVRWIQTQLPDLVILDLMLPGLDGLEICRLLKRDPKTMGIPILILTAKSEEADRVVGLELGADDYVTKPFSLRELVARVKVILRRSAAKQGESGVDKVLVCGDLRVDLERRIAWVKNKRLPLTMKEFDLLSVLMQAKGRVLNREQLLEKVWGLDRSLEIETRTVDVHVAQLRRKLFSAARTLITLKGVGYRWDWE